MGQQAVTAIVSSLVGGFLVAILAYLSTRPKTLAEARKIDAEAARIRVETERMAESLELGVGQRTVAQAPLGWFLAGSSPDSYKIGLDTSVRRTGTASGVLFSKEKPDGFGTLMQDFSAISFRGCRLRLSAFVRTRGVEDRAGLWMRIDGPGGESELDNMSDRPISGNTDWNRHSIVLDVSEDARIIAFGVLLRGEGQVWVDDFKFEKVDRTTPTTGRGESPINLDFETS